MGREETAERADSGTPKNAAGYRSVIPPSTEIAWPVM